MSRRFKYVFPGDHIKIISAEPRPQRPANLEGETGTVTWVSEDFGRIRIRLDDYYTQSEIEFGQYPKDIIQYD